MSNVLLQSGDTGDIDVNGLVQSSAGDISLLAAGGLYVAFPDVVTIVPTATEKRSLSATCPSCLEPSSRASLFWIPMQPVRSSPKPGKRPKRR